MAIAPRSARRAAEIAGAHPRVAGLQIGYGDLFTSLGIAQELIAFLVSPQAGTLTGAEFRIDGGSVPVV